jgi:hypothetical protein
MAWHDAHGVSEFLSSMALLIEHRCPAFGNLFDELDDLAIWTMVATFVVRLLCAWRRNLQQAASRK